MSPQSTLKPLTAVVLSFAAAGHAQNAPTPITPLRPPSVPLVACDPYFSIWSNADKLTDDTTRHWTGTKQSLTGLIRIDGQSFRLMGNQPAATPALPQTSVRVFPTRTVYNFEGAGTHVTLTFTTPALPEDLDVLSRPVTYVTWDVRSTDGKPHRISLYADASSELAVNTTDQRVRTSRSRVGNLDALRIGSVDQPVLGKSGDNLRIDWGYLYAAARRGQAKSVLASADAAQSTFIADGSLPRADDSTTARAVSENTPVSAFVFDLGRVGTRNVSRHWILAYDDEYSVTYMRRKMRPYWRRNGANAADLLRTSEREYPSLKARCEQFDAALMTDLTRAGGVKYAQLAALAHRQAIAAQKIVADANGQPLSFSKENFSNGSIGTVDLMYPASPQMIALSPGLLKATLEPMLNYAASPRWKFPFAPHDVGTYPLANGQTYGGGERTEENQMPVEESGNLLILAAAVAMNDGNTRYLDRHWPLLTKWAQYLEEKGFDPENQLSTDDFSGHLAHNTNLSVKAIEALGAYSMLCRMRGDQANAAKYRAVAEQFAARWVREADDGEKFRLAFDRPNTWSQKYNMVWDRILGLNLFPQSVKDKEMAFYRKTQNRYGLPLDNRDNFTKLDWTIWTATLTGRRDDFIALTDPIYDFLNDSPSRVPMTDWYRTTNATQVGFQARSAIGGVFIPMITDPTIWRRWASRDKSRLGNNWAPIPLAPLVREIVASGENTNGITWRYTTQQPAANWFETGFNDAAWNTGAGGFGTRNTPTINIRTEWTGSDIWLRRSFDFNGAVSPKLKLYGFHDEDAEVYINGVLAARLPGYNATYEYFDISPAALATLKPGQNVMAIHVHQSNGGQGVDFGLAEVTER